MSDIKTADNSFSDDFTGTADAFSALKLLVGQQ